MASYNHVTIMGHLTRDPELRYTPGGSAVCDIGIAVSEKYKKGDELVKRTNFFNVTAWGKTGENVASHKKKGDCILVHGKLRHETWESDGKKNSTVKIVADQVIFLPRAQPAGQQSSSGGKGSSRRDEEAPQTYSDADIPF